MKTLELALESTNGHINSITRNTAEGWWELEIGLPNGWVFDENNKIGCEIVFENEVGKLIRVFPKKKDIVVDDLIAFVEIIILTNEKIAEKEKQFKNKMQEMKGLLEKEAKSFYQELDELKENSFKNLNNAFAKDLEKPKTPRKPRTPKTSSNTITDTKTVSEETESIDESPNE